MTPRSFVVTLAGIATLTLSCSQAPTGPSVLSLEASVTRPAIALGETDTLTFRLRNLTAHAITMSFGSSCQVVPFIAQSEDGIVYPPGGGWVCATVVTTLTLAPFAEKVITQAVRGDTVQVSFPGAVLPRGSYQGYAVLETNTGGFQVRSAAVPFEIR